MKRKYRIDNEVPSGEITEYIPGDSIPLIIKKRKKGRVLNVRWVMNNSRNSFYGGQKIKLEELEDEVTNP